MRFWKAENAVSSFQFQTYQGTSLPTINHHIITVIEQTHAQMFDD